LGGVEQDYDAILGDAERVLDDVDEALARIDARTYTTCEHCGATISEDRLAAHPVARSCEHHPQLTDPLD